MLYQLSDLHLYRIQKSISNPDMIILLIISKMCKYFLVISFIAADKFKGTIPNCVWMNKNSSPESMTKVYLSWRIMFDMVCEPL